MSELDKLIEAVEAGGFIGPSLIFHLHENASLAFSAHYGDLNAAKALHEALLTGWNFVAGVNWAEVFNVDAGMPYGKGFNVYNDNPARAWLICILKAYRSMQ